MECTFVAVVVNGGKQGELGRLLTPTVNTSSNPGQMNILFVVRKSPLKRGVRILRENGKTATVLARPSCNRPVRLVTCPVAAPATRGKFAKKNGSGGSPPYPRARPPGLPGPQKHCG